MKEPERQFQKTKSEGSASFCEQKEAKKLLLRWDLAPIVRVSVGNRSFLLLFFKKEALSLVY
jgi:hypothetical protein